MEGIAANYAASITGITPLLYLALAELENWNCCGANATTVLPAKNVKIWDLLNFLTQISFLDTYEKKVVYPLTGLNAVS